MPGTSGEFEVGNRQKTPERRYIGGAIPPEAKVFNDRAELVKTIEAFRHLNARIVLTSGTFDIIHIGHAKYLERAKEHGDILIVGVDSDEKVRDRKGPDRPVVPEEERVAMLAYLRSVDVITVKQRDDPHWDLIKAIRPDTLIVTEETYDDATRQQLEEYCGEVVCLEPQATTSTTAKIREVQVGARKKIMEPINEILERFDEDQRRASEQLRRIIGQAVLGGTEIEEPTDDEPNARESA